MAAKKGHEKWGGRKKGTPNKVTAIAKDVIAQVAADLGGAERLLTWCRQNKSNEGTFWTYIFPRLLPLQTTNENDNRTFNFIFAPAKKKEG
jgi:hypothetical protein